MTNAYLSLIKTVSFIFSLEKQKNSTEQMQYFLITPNVIASKINL